MYFKQFFLFLLGPVTDAFSALNQFDTSFAVENVVSDQISPTTNQDILTGKKEMRDPVELIGGKSLIYALSYLAGFVILLLRPLLIAGHSP